MLEARKNSDSIIENISVTILYFMAFYKELSNLFEVISVYVDELHFL